MIIRIKAIQYSHNGNRPNGFLHRLLLWAAALSAMFLSACEQPASPSAQAVKEPTEVAKADNSKPLILVAGVTGRQGRALARQLLKLGYPVRGTTRNPSSDKAEAMAALGVEIVSADFLDPESLAKASENIYGLFFYTPGGPQEVVMGQNVTDAALIANVKHVVYTTYLSADPTNGYPENQPKRSIENYIREQGIGYTFLRPVTFMENFAGRQSSIVSKGISGPQAPDYIGQYISVEDIAFFAAEAFEKPGEWLGKELNIASDEMTQQEVAELFSTILDQPVTYTQTSWEEAAKRMSPQLLEIFQWYETSGFKVDVAGLRNRYPNLTTLENYLRKTNWEDWAPQP